MDLATSLQVVPFLLAEATWQEHLTTPLPSVIK
jgi:hypothetical protein